MLESSPEEFKNVLSQPTTQFKQEQITQWNKGID